MDSKHLRRLRLIIQGTYRAMIEGKLEAGRARKLIHRYVEEAILEKDFDGKSGPSNGPRRSFLSEDL